jgi:hypothetical protein
MSSILIPFPVFEQPPAPQGHASAVLSARVAVGVSNATKTMARYPQVVAHADEDSRRLVVLMMMEIIGRAAIEPTTTANEILAALYELVPEGTRSTNGGAA